MDQIAFISREHHIYWSSVLLLVGIGVAIFLFLSLYLNRGGRMIAAFSLVPMGVFLSFFWARLIHWYCFSESYSGFWAAMGDFTQGSFALVGAFVGCALAVGILYGAKLLPDPGRMLDCLCLAGGAGMTVGRMSFFFSTADRGQILANIRSLPLASPVVNVVSKATEYRLATFLLQSIAAGVLTLVLTGIYLSRRGKKWKDGEASLIFLLCYCAGQIVLDSTRYDSMYFRSNGFVSVVQVLSLVALVSISVFYCMHLVKRRGFHPGQIALWVLMVGLLGIAGYMEYYVQRHGNRAAMAYGIMSLSLCVFVAITLRIRATARKKKPQHLKSR